MRPRIASRSPGRAAAAVLCLLGLAVAACGSDPAGSSSASGSPPRSGSPALSGSLTVFAAASLTEAFRDAASTLENSHPGLSVTYSFAGSQQLVSNVKNGAPADVIATADAQTMRALVTAGLVETPRTFARNRLEIAVARGNPKAIRGLADLADPRIAVVLADPSVPAGRFARQAFQKAGVTVTPKSNELDVKAALQKVAAGDADAAVVYTTDVSSAADRVDGVSIPDSQNVIAVYPIAVVRSTQHRDAAVAFVDEAVAGDVQRALRRRGFLAP